MKEQPTAVFPGSFDPVTKGHEYIIKTAVPLFKKIIIAIGENSSKKSMFPLEQRKEWLQKTFSAYDNIEIDSYNCLTVDSCKLKNANFIIRGLRNAMDFIYEQNIDTINNELCGGIQSVFFISPKEYTHVSSSFVKEMILYNKDINKYLPQAISDKDIKLSL